MTISPVYLMGMMKVFKSMIIIPVFVASDFLLVVKCTSEKTLCPYEESLRQRFVSEIC